VPVKEKIICLLKGIALLLAVGYLFYGKIIYGIFLMPYLYVYYGNSKKQYVRRVQDDKIRQFKDGMMALNSALSAGYSIENSFREALGELRVLYGRQAHIVKGFEQIVHKLAMNGNVEEALKKFAEDMDVEDARYFAEVFCYAKRSGGDMTAIIRKTTENLNGKLEVKREISTLITGKRMEQKVMNIVPFAIILYIRMAAGEFIQALYGNTAGVLVMTGCLGVYVLSIRWAEKIIDIEV
jgi:tight adherence protein B